MLDVLTVVTGVAALLLGAWCGWAAYRDQPTKDWHFIGMAVVTVLALLHNWNDFLQQVSAQGWEVTWRRDITAHVMPTLRVLEMWANRAGIPLLQYAICKLRHKQPALHYMLADALATLDQQIEHHMNMIRPADFMRDRRYLMLVLERTCDLDQVRRRASRSADGSRDTDPTTIDPLEECQPMPA